MILSKPRLKEAAVHAQEPASVASKETEHSWFDSIMENTNMTGIGKHGNRFALLLGAVVFVLAGAQTAPAQAGLLGDVNLDGAVNVLDIQSTINQALGLAAYAPEADLDENAQVDILDLQNAINTVLGTGGLVQCISGTVECDGTPDRLRIIAVSMDGLCEQCEVDPETNRFRLRLRVKSSWAFALCAQEGPLERCIGTVDFPIVDTVSCTLPIPGLSFGGELDLGLLRFAHRARAQREIREMIGDMGSPLNPSDDNGNGVPDFVEPLLERLRNGPGVPPDIDLEPLLEAVADCIAAWAEQYTEPDLTDADENGIPDFLEPLIECIKLALQDWLENAGVFVPPGDQNANGIPDFIDAIVHHLVQGIPEWMHRLGRPELVDDNANGIPDFIEDYLSVDGIPSFVDSDGDGIPDFAEDDDADGIPNILDPDAWVAGDLDGDGVANDPDLDDDNDGIPDYADAG